MVTGTGSEVGSDPNTEVVAHKQTTLGSEDQIIITKQANLVVQRGGNA